MRSGVIKKIGVPPKNSDAVSFFCIFIGWFLKKITKTSLYVSHGILKCLAPAAPRPLVLSGVHLPVAISVISAESDVGRNKNS